MTVHQQRPSLGPHTADPEAGAKTTPALSSFVWIKLFFALSGLCVCIFVVVDFFGLFSFVLLLFIACLFFACFFRFSASFVCSILTYISCITVLPVSTLTKNALTTRLVPVT